MDRYPHGVYQNVMRALSCMFRIGIEVFEIIDVPVEIADGEVVDPEGLRLLVGNAKFAWLNTLSASPRTSMRTRSVMANDLPSDRPTVSSPGPVN